MYIMSISLMHVLRVCFLAAQLMDSSQIWHVSAFQEPWMHHLKKTVLKMVLLKSVFSTQQSQWTGGEKNVAK